MGAVHWSVLGEDCLAIDKGQNTDNSDQMPAWQFQMLQNIAEKHGWHKFISMQNYYNLLYREEEREMIPYCKATGVGLIPVCSYPKKKDRVLTISRNKVVTKRAWLAGPPLEFGRHGISALTD